MSTAPVPRLDGAAIQIKNLLYVFAGYGTIDYVRILTCTLILWMVGWWNMLLLMLDFPFSWTITLTRIKYPYSKISPLTSIGTACCKFEAYEELETENGWTVFGNRNWLLIFTIVPLGSQLELRYLRFDIPMESKLNSWQRLPVFHDIVTLLVISVMHESWDIYVM